MQRDRLEFLPYIKDTLESPQVVVRQVDGALIFAKDFRDDKLGKFFASVSKNDNGEWVISSNAPKNLNNLQNKIKEGGEVLYSDLPELPIIAKPELPAKALNSEANLSAIIPQSPQEIIKQAKASGKSVAETKELLQKHKEKDSIQDNPQVSALQTKIQQTRQQIAESPNPDKEYLHQVFKPDEIIQLEKQYFNQAMPQEYKELIQDFPRLYEQSLANKLKTYVKDTDTIQEVTTNLLNDFKDKPFKDTAKHAELLLFNTLKDKAQELGFKKLDINEPSFKVAFKKLQARLKKGDIQDLSEHIAINSLRKNRLRIQEKLNINPIKEFGTNYAEHYHSGESAIAKLLAERQGQVAGAFYRKELGDIDLVWGDSKMGLAHILERRTDDFIKQGLSKEEAEAKAKEFVKEIPQIIENGEVVENAGVKTIILKDKNIEHRVGLSKGFNGKGENEWILTAYKRENPHAQNFDQATNSKELESGNNLSLIDSAPNLSTKEIIKQAKEQGLSQVQSNTNAQQLTLHDIQERLTARKKELEQQSKDLSTELKTQEKQANRVAPILKELLQKWRALNPLIIEWKERKEIRGKFGQFLGYEKKLSKRKPNLSNLEHIEKTLEAYKSYAKNNEDSAESVKKEISLLEDYVEKLKNKQNKQNIQNLIEHSQSKEQILSDERRKINTYHDLRQNFNKGHHTDLQILEGNNIPQEQHKQLLEFISQTRSYIESNFNINPLKEFGTNYAEFYKDGKGAIQKLLSEAKDYETRKEAGSLTEDEVKQGAYKGQVAGAFYKEGLGDIDLVWGEVTDPKNHKGYGLAHILDKHPDLDPRLITEIIEKGNLTNQNNIRYRIEKDNYVIGLSAEYKGDKRNFIITAFEKNKDKRDTFTEHPFTSTSDNAVKNLDKKENAESLYTSSAITKGETLPLNSKEDSTIKAINESIKRYKEKIKALDDPKLQKERAEKKQKIIDEFNETLYNASPTTKLDKWGTHFSILYIKPEGKKRLQKLKFDTQERIQEAIHHYTNNDRLKMELNVLWNVYNKLKEIDVEYLREKQRLETILKGYENDLKNIGVSDLPTTKD
ncbi:putative barnase/colicin E5 family endoribonuclease, partial [Helicobacter trogontum]|uniref:putative barnase/colicin E5 family endoribonuclease n=1 Tax=Helicobacter trogontum TaxID=50960 RepID=UPI0022794556